MNPEQLKTRYERAEKLARKLRATKIWKSKYGDFVAEFGKNFYGKVEVNASIKYGGVYDVQITGASFKFDNRQDCLAFIKNLQNATKVYDALKS